MAGLCQSYGNKSQIQKQLLILCSILGRKVVCFLGWSIPYLHRMVQTCLHFSIKFLLVAKFRYCSFFRNPQPHLEWLFFNPFKILVIFTVYLFISTHWYEFLRALRLLAFPTGVGVKDKVYVIVMTCGGRGAPESCEKNQWIGRKTSKKNRAMRLWKP